MQVLKNGQWWSNCATQQSHTGQWTVLCLAYLLHPAGLNIPQVLQKLSYTKWVPSPETIK